MKYSSLLNRRASAFASTLASVALLSVSLSSCSVLGGSKSYKISGSGETVQSTSAPSASASSDKALQPPKATPKKAKAKKDKAAKPVKASKKKGKAPSGNKASASARKPTVVKDETRQTLEAAAAAGATAAGVKAADKAKPAQSALPKDFTIGGEWTIYSVRNNVLRSEDRPYVAFDLVAKRFYGYNGCNYLNGDIESDGGESLRLVNTISTMRMCDGVEFEYLINLALADVTQYRAYQDGRITFLDLKGKDGQTLMVLRRHNMEFLNGIWHIDTLEGTAMPADSAEDAARMTLNTTDLQVHGTTGCNIFNGEIFIDPDKKDSLQFINIGTTRMACPDGSRETEVLLALESVESARLTSPEHVTLYSADGKQLMTLTKLHMVRE